MSLPTDYKERKALPLATGLIDYFPDALAEVARVSKIGNDQHNPGEPLHWDRTKSTDEADALMRHFVDRYKKDSDGSYHAAKVVWRGLAFLQKLIEAEREKALEETTPALTRVYYTPEFLDTLRYQLAMGRSKLDNSKTTRPSNGQWGDVCSDQADGCSSHSSAGYEANAKTTGLPRQRHLFNGDGDRNG